MEDLKCYQCPLKFTDEWILKNHKQDHIGEYWECKDCGIIYDLTHGRVEIVRIAELLLKRYKYLKVEKPNHKLNEWMNGSSFLK